MIELEINERSVKRRKRKRSIGHSVSVPTGGRHVVSGWTLAGDAIERIALYTRRVETPRVKRVPANGDHKQDFSQRNQFSIGGGGSSAAANEFRRLESGSVQNIVVNVVYFQAPRRLQQDLRR